jgi:hypothetical protein
MERFSVARDCRCNASAAAFVDLVSLLGKCPVDILINESIIRDTDVLEWDKYPGVNRIRLRNSGPLSGPHANPRHILPPPVLHLSLRELSVIARCLSRPQRGPVPLAYCWTYVLVPTMAAPTPPPFPRFQRPPKMTASI